jgi:hypothetical protein
MADPLKTQGKLLQFTLPRIVSGLSAAPMFEDLIASNRQLVGILERLCEVCSRGVESQQALDEESFSEELRVALAEAKRLSAILKENTFDV